MGCMTRNKEEARAFWLRFDKEVAKRNLQLKDIAQACGLPYGSVTGWRNKHLFPDIEAIAEMVKHIGCSLDDLLGIDGQKKLYDPRVRAIADWLSEDDGRVSAMEKLIFGEKVGASSKVI